MALYELQRGIPGLIFGNFYDSDSGILQDTPVKNPEGGQAVFRISGREDEVTTIYDDEDDTTIFGGVQIRNDVGMKKVAGDCIAFIKRGQVWVEAGGTISAGDKAYYDTATNTFVNTSTGTIDVNGFFKTNARIGSEVILELCGNV